MDAKPGGTAEVNSNFCPSVNWGRSFFINPFVPATRLENKEEKSSARRGSHFPSENKED